MVPIPKLENLLIVFFCTTETDNASLVCERVINMYVQQNVKKSETTQYR
jgi:hypothetical protein